MRFWDGYELVRHVVAVVIGLSMSVVGLTVAVPLVQLTAEGDAG